MEFANQLILVGAGLVALSVVVGLVSSRFGAPLLLVFLFLGMLAGEDGPGGIQFDDFQTAYTVGSIALAIILFDGGLRTEPRDMRAALASASLLATVGVLITAALVGAAAKWLLGIGWLEGLLVGAIVASTDAAAVFLLLHGRGLRIRERMRSILEVEAGLNDPMAVFLTVTCVSLIEVGTFSADDVVLQLLFMKFVMQAAGGIVIGVLSGFVLLWLTNRLNIAPGLYPVLSVSSALLIFSGAQEIGASGFLAAYLAGFIFGSRRHRATQIIDRFHDGLAWLSQIALFLMLGLLVTPSGLLPNLLPALGVAAVLILVGRPVATWLCLPPFRFDFKETWFVSWVGLRGAVPIYLGTIPVLAGLENARLFFDVVYVVVITSLIVQGWTVAIAARRFGLVLPPRPQAPLRMDIDLPTEVGREITMYTVEPTSLALRRALSRFPIPSDTTVISIYRDGEMRRPEDVDTLAAGDQVLLMAPAEQLALLDRMFGKRSSSDGQEDGLMGEFFFPGQTPVASIGETYGFSVPRCYRDMTVEAFMRRHMMGRPRPGRRLRLGLVELVMHDVTDDAGFVVAVELEPRDWSLHRIDPAMMWGRGLVWDPLVSSLGRVWRRLTGRPPA